MPFQNQDLTSLLLSGACVLGIKGKTFILIAANATGAEDSAVQQPSPAHPLIGAVGCSVDKVFFSDFILDVAWKYKNNKHVTVPLEYWNELAPQLRKLPSSPFGLNIVLAGVDDTGRGFKELMDPISFYNFCASFPFTSNEQPNTFPYYHNDIDVALCQEGNITWEKAVQLANMLFGNVAMPNTPIEMHIMPKASNEQIISKVFVKKNENVQKEEVTDK